jgi:organic radical activating enzyme
MSKVDLKLFVVNITNVCNYNCPDCQTFSNFNFSGHQLWKDYQDIYKKWANIIEPRRWNIQGGEPLLNPSFNEWVLGLNELFPNSPGEVSTNGSTIKANDQKLYNLFLNVKAGFLVRFQLHNKARRKEAVELIKNWLQGPIKVFRLDQLSDEVKSELMFDRLDFESNKEFWINKYSAIKSDSWPKCQTLDDWQFLPDYIKKECSEVFNLHDPNEMFDLILIDKNNIAVYLNTAHIFSSSALIPSDDRTHFRLHNSDPTKAWEVCMNKMCFNFYKGKAYQCHEVAHFSDFNDQFNLILDNENDKELLYSYNAATSEMTVDEFQKFIDNRMNPIPQCKFCPETMEYNTLHASTKKIFFQKKK